MEPSLAPYSQVLLQGLSALKEYPLRLLIYREAEKMHADEASLTLALLQELIYELNAEGGQDANAKAEHDEMVLVAQNYILKITNGYRALAFHVASGHFPPLADCLPHPSFDQAAYVFCCTVSSAWLFLCTNTVFLECDGQGGHLAQLGDDFCSDSSLMHRFINVISTDFRSTRTTEDFGLWWLRDWLLANPSPMYTSGCKEAAPIPLQ
ncbi:hypothetical protein DL96DRAFT_1720304 [Flagelloscypha sp. PMI_526]|nr:hypothetical protein DL96DRAFT_1720304 [Flagelloscypha sp. PMI_526]